MENSLQEKQSKLESMLQKGVVMIYLDARKPGVRLPAHLETQAYVALNLSYRFSPPDLAVNTWGVRATLSFEGRLFPVAVPWPAVFAIRSHVTMEFWLFPEDVPEAFLETQEAQKIPPPSPGKRSTFQLVHSVQPEAEGEASTPKEALAKEEEEAGEEAEERKPKATPTHLRLLH